MSFSSRLGRVGIVFGLWLTFTGHVLAIDDFSRTLNLTYTILDSGETQAKYEIRLKNNLSTVYAKQYALTLNSNDVTNIEVRDQEGKPLPWEQNARENQTTIAVKLDQGGKVLGRDKEVTFSISFLSHDAASIYGRVLEVAVPKLAAPQEYAQYNVILNVPAKFGPPSIVEPARYTFDSIGTMGVLRFHQRWSAVRHLGSYSGTSKLTICD